MAAMAIATERLLIAPFSVPVREVRDPDRDEERVHPAVLVLDAGIRDVPVTNPDGDRVFCPVEEMRAAAGLRAELERSADPLVLQRRHYEAFAAVEVRHEPS